MKHDKSERLFCKGIFIRLLYAHYLYKKPYDADFFFLKKEHFPDRVFF